MYSRRTLILFAALNLVCLLLGMGLARSSHAQPPAGAGRYQVAINSLNSGGYVIVIDTVTGHCWSHNPLQSGDAWLSLGTPVGGK